MTTPDRALAKLAPLSNTVTKTSRLNNTRRLAWLCVICLLLLLVAPAQNCQAQGGAFQAAIGLQHVASTIAAENLGWHHGFYRSHGYHGYYGGGYYGGGWGYRGLGYGYSGWGTGFGGHGYRFNGWGGGVPYSYHSHRWSSPSYPYYHSFYRPGYALGYGHFPYAYGRYGLPGGGYHGIGYSVYGSHPSGYSGISYHTGLSTGYVSTGDLHGISGVGISGVGLAPEYGYNSLYPYGGLGSYGLYTRPMFTAAYVVPTPGDYAFRTAYAGFGGVPTGYGCCGTITGDLE